MTTTDYDALPLSTSPLTVDEALDLETVLIPLLRYLGSPGDWGYGSQLGQITMALLALRVEVRAAARAAAREGET